MLPHASITPAEMLAHDTAHVCFLCCLGPTYRQHCSQIERMVHPWHRAAVHGAHVSLSPQETRNIDELPSGHMAIAMLADSKVGTISEAQRCNGAPAPTLSEL
jgi:hypothetical protein